MITIELLNSKLAMLSQTERQALRLMLTTNLTNSEINKELGVSHNYVYWLKNESPHAETVQMFLNLNNKFKETKE
ncbi:hypothetical protein ACP75B_15405 [Vibrio cholerae]|uniref:Uncharacterized protein n=2 Tax=Vibrio cholerae TaxID=666 RepID=M1SVG1_VIBCE|nr:hypothetical protein [Vibrio cholerae]AGG36646.1 hypothetical protein [Vibrio cholerae O1 biovar El Tor]EGQ8257900.1 hypothetical protein [Vibrio cholerae]EGR0460990.1 hypothetical protein [Vibrio cholerae]EGR0472551.1 hypothetical protein [Vibrio cholerae]EGR0514285.1 hypothetical protein [Vibrio cholerae]